MRVMPQDVTLTPDGERVQYCARAGDFSHSIERWVAVGAGEADGAAEKSIDLTADVPLEEHPNSRPLLLWSLLSRIMASRLRRAERGQRLEGLTSAALRPAPPETRCRLFRALIRVWKPTRTTHEQALRMKVRRCPSAVDSSCVSGTGDSSADHRYATAYRECTAATEHLAEQHHRRTLKSDRGRPVLDPQYEAALDQLEAAERQLRSAYLLCNAAANQLQNAG